MYIRAVVLPALGVGVMNQPVNELVRLSPRVHNAISSASSGNAVGIRPATRHPTMRREYTSITNAINAVPVHVEK